MNRYLFALVLTVFMMLSLSACKKNIEAATEITSEPAVESTMESVMESTAIIPEETVLGVADSIFDNDGNLDESGAVVTPDAPVKNEIPQQSEQVSETESTKSEVKPSDNTDPTTSTEPVSATSPTIPEDTKPTVTPGEVQPLTEYEKYNAMSGEEQMAYMQSFDTIEAFFVWYNNAKAEYEALHPDIVIGNDVIDAGDLVG